MTKQEIENRIAVINNHLSEDCKTLVNEKVESDLDIIDIDSRYDEMLDEVHDTVRIGCCTFDPSRILSELDPIAYRCGLSDFVDAEESDDRIVEIKGNYYDYDEVEEIKDAITSELESELEELETELEELENNEVEG